MPREKLAFQRNNIIRRYSGGESAASIGRSLSATTTTITRILKGAGCMPALGRGDHKRRADEGKLITLFQSGMKPSAICRTSGVSKSGLYGILKRSGADLRGHIDEARTDADLIKLALGREAAGRCNENEQLFRDLIAERGFKSNPQVALGTGVIDFVIPDYSVAVEVNLRGTFNRYITEGWFTQRIKNCSNRGWHFYVFGGRDRSDINADSIQDICAWMEFLNRSPASRRQYRVVWGGTELLSTGCSDDNQITIPKPSAYASQVASRKNPS